MIESILANLFAFQAMHSFSDVLKVVRRSGEKAMLVTMPVCPVKVVVQTPDAKSHTRASNELLGEKAMALTGSE